MLHIQTICLIAAKQFILIWIPDEDFIVSSKALKVGQSKMLKF